VEAAMMQTPFVMVYCVSSPTYFLGKPRVKVPYFAMVNLIAGEQIVPELVQHDFTAANVVEHVRQILPEGPARSRILRGLALVRDKLRLAGTLTGSPVQSAAEKAAEMIVSMLPSGASCRSGNIE
jgi:lipid-A-disaccharide synthase